MPFAKLCGHAWSFRPSKPAPAASERRGSISTPEPGQARWPRVQRREPGEGQRQTPRQRRVGVDPRARPGPGHRRATAALRHGQGHAARCERELAARIHAIQTGTHVDVSRETVAQYLSRWLRDYAKPSVAPRTYERYAEIVTRHLVPQLGAGALARLQPAHIVAAERGWLDFGLSASTVLKFHRLLREAFHHAVKWRLIAVNPAHAVTPPRVERREMSVLSPSQATALLAQSRGTEFEAVMTTALYSGLPARGAARGLRWRDLDLDAGRLSVQQTLQKVPGGGVVARQPKTHRSRRSVSLPSALVDVLREHRRRQVEARLLAGDAWADGDLVFTDALGRALSETRLRWAFWRLLREAGLPRIRLHDLRHTMATLMLAAGEHPKVVSERLGHSTVSITLDTYSHVLPGLQAAAAERLAATRGPCRLRSPAPAEGDFLPRSSAIRRQASPRTPDLRRTPKGRRSGKPLQHKGFLAERGGFEPPVAHHHTAFRERHHQPLGHLSGG